MSAQATGLGIGPTIRAKPQRGGPNEREQVQIEATTAERE
jgi:hypothetical protein